MNLRKMVLSSLFAALTALCAWLSIPVGSVAFTMQSFAVFLALAVLGGKWGSLSIGVYLLLGAVGLPVFSGFQGGIGALLGPTGGYLWGFALAGLAYWGFEKLCKPIGMILGLLLCYACGCAWFVRYSGGIGWSAAVMTCVVPYLLPDAIKLWLAHTLSRRIGKYLYMER